MPVVAKHRLSSTGAKVPSAFFVARLNSTSKTACTPKPAAAQAAIWRLRKVRGQAAQGEPS